MAASTSRPVGGKPWNSATCFLQSRPSTTIVGGQVLVVGDRPDPWNAPPAEKPM
jgi:hypothetical protein